jgi:hypothetical protein
VQCRKSVSETGTSQSKHNLGWTSEEGEHQVRARQPIGQGGGIPQLGWRGGKHAREKVRETTLIRTGQEPVAKSPEIRK